MIERAQRTRSPIAVCLIDDDALFRAHLSESLRARGFDVSSGTAGLALMAAKPPAAVVDVLMPSMDGLEVLEDIRLLMPHVRRNLQRRALEGWLLSGCRQGVRR